MSSQQDAYDPSAPEGDSSGKNQYFSKRDIKMLGIILVVLGIILWPIYQYGKGQSEKSRCTQNVKAIYQALQQYSINHDDRLPPIYRTDVIGGTAPGLGEDGKVYTFASDVAGYMSRRASFTCPSADLSEAVPTESPEADLKINSTYGMYAPYGGYLSSVIPNPSETLILAETSNHGARGSYNPKPFIDVTGKEVPWDGFVIGWDNSNGKFGRDGSSLVPDRGAKAVTRLAFRDSADGHFANSKPSRHDSGIHAISADGQLVLIKPKSANVNIQRSTGLPIGSWEAPP